MFMFWFAIFFFLLSPRNTISILRYYSFFWFGFVFFLSTGLFQLLNRHTCNKFELVSINETVCFCNAFKCIEWVCLNPSKSCSFIFCGFILVLLDSRVGESLLKVLYYLLLVLILCVCVDVAEICHWQSMHSIVQWQSLWWAPYDFLFLFFIFLNFLCVCVHFSILWNNRLYPIT